MSKINRYEGDKKIFRFSDFVNESKEDKQVHPRPLNVIEKYHVKMLVDFLEVVYEYTGNKGYKEKNEKEYNEFKDKLQAFKNLPFAKEMVERTKEIDKKLSTRDEANKGIGTVKAKAFETSDKIIELLKKGDLEGAYKLNATLKTALDEIAKGSISTGETVSLPNHYRKQSSFFGSDDFLSDFDEGDLKKLSQLDYSKELYTYMNFPQKKLDDFKYLAYFAMNLKDSPKAVRLSGDSFRKWHEMLHLGDAKYNVLIQKVQDYLYSNKKDLIPAILQEMKKFPELEKANEKRKREIKTVYRGLGFHYRGEDDEQEFTTEEVIENDKKNRYVATSLSFNAARNFEYMKGHLEGGRNSDYGFMIQYEVGPESILLDTSIFGGAYGGVESEVLIDTTKAKVKEAKKSTKGYGREAA